MERVFSPKRVKDVQQQLGVSNRELGKRLNPLRPENGRKMVLAHLRGLHVPTVGMTERYAEALGVQVELITEEDDVADQLAAIEAMLEEAAA